MYSSITYVWVVSVRLAIVPGNAGHLFYVLGAFPGGTHPDPVDGRSALKRSCDGGTTWSYVASTQEAWSLALWKARAGNTYPAIYFSGYVNGNNTPGVFRSDDATTNCASALTWTRLSSAPNGTLDLPNAMAASWEVYGKVFLGMSSTGYIYGRLAQ